MGRVRESVFDGTKHIILMADIVRIRKVYQEDPNKIVGCYVYTKNSSGLYLQGLEAIHFMIEWDSYRCKPEEEISIKAEDFHRPTGQLKTITANKVLNEIAVVVRRIERAGRDGVSGTARKQRVRALEILSVIKHRIPDDVLVLLDPPLYEAFQFVGLKWFVETMFMEKEATDETSTQS